MLRVSNNKPKRRRFRARLLCIDPGLGGTGWAYFGVCNKLTKDVYSIPELNAHLVTGVIKSKSKKGADWLDRSSDILQQFSEVMDEFTPTHVVIEWPQVWRTSQTSMAATLSGDLLKLAHLCGMLNCEARLNDAEIHYFTPSQWKGQLPKDVVDRRIKQVIDRSFPNHAADAVGIGLAVQGLL